MILSMAELNEAMKQFTVPPASMLADIFVRQEIDFPFPASDAPSPFAVKIHVAEWLPKTVKDKDGKEVELLAIMTSAGQDRVSFLLGKLIGV